MMIFWSSEVKLFVFHCLGPISKGHKYTHSHKKRKDSLEGTLDWVLFAVELELPNILVPRPPQHTSDVNIKCAGKSVWPKRLYYLHATSLTSFGYIFGLCYCVSFYSFAFIT